MCGICGIYTTSAVRDHRDSVARMVGALKHRGPDDAGWEVREGSEGERVYLGNARLSVIDTSPLGHQPMTSGDGNITVVFNGEIYNHPDIREILLKKGHSFRSSSDTEVLLNAYLEWGTGALELFNGMFVFAAWDRRTDELFVARDRLGIKPLYFSFRDGNFFFASEIKALFSCDLVEPRIDPGGLAEFLSYQFTLTPGTIFADIRKLAPGSYIKVRRGKLTHGTYWALKDIEHDGISLNIQDIEETLMMMIREAVRKRLVSDVPLGVFLSGGLDSSIITGLMAEMTGRRIKTFSMGFPAEGEESYNELKYARKVARHFDTDHHEYTARPEDIEREIENIAYHFDEPFGGGLHTYFISELARKNVTVVLSGLGGDELFAGYEWNRLEKITQLYGRIPAFLRRGMIGRIMAPLPFEPLKGNLIHKIKKLSVFDRVDPSERYPLWISVFDPQAIKGLVENRYAGRDIGLSDPTGRFREHAEEVPSWNHQDKLLYLQITTTMLDDFLNYTDKMSMAHSLECRVPFLDHEFVQFALNIPFRYKMKGLTGKHILKRCARKMLPADIIDRPKQGFIMPFDIWMRGKLKPLVLDCLLGTRGGGDEILNTESIKRVTTDFFDRGLPLARQVWSLFTFKLWMDVFERRLTQPGTQPAEAVETRGIQGDGPCETQATF